MSQHENSDIYKIFCDRLKTLRGHRSKAEFARVLGIKNPQTYHRYEDGQIPNHTILNRICDTESVTLDWLLGRDNSNDPSVEYTEPTAPQPLKEEPPSYGSPDTATRQHAVISNSKLLVDIIQTLPESDRVTGWFASSLMSARTAIDPTEKPEDAQRAAKETKRILDRIFNHAKKSRK